MAICRLIVFTATLTLCAACAKMEEPPRTQPTPQPTTPPAQQAAAPAASYEQELEQWKAKRLAGLKSEDGWL